MNVNSTTTALVRAFSKVRSPPFCDPGVIGVIGSGGVKSEPEKNHNIKFFIYLFIIHFYVSDKHDAL